MINYSKIFKSLKNSKLQNKKKNNKILITTGNYYK